MGRGNPDAAEKGQFKEDRVVQHQDGDETRQATEAGGCYRPVHGWEIQKVEQEEVVTAQQLQ